MLELFHNPFSTCSQKVRLVLDEKGLEFVSHEIDLIAGQQHDPDYVRLNPAHVVPTLLHDGAVFVESTLINEYLDEAFADHPMRPADAAGRHAVRLWTQQLDGKVHPATAVVTFAMGPRMLLLAQPQEVREANLAAIPDPHDRETRRIVIEQGVESPPFLGALQTMIGMLDRAERDLAAGPWLSGPAYGLADAAVFPYVLRMEHLAMDPLLGEDTRPRLAAWLARCKQRPSYASAVVAWAPDSVVDFLRMQGQALWPAVEAQLAG